MIETSQTSMRTTPASRWVLGHAFLAANLLFAVSGQLLLKFATLQGHMHPETWSSYVWLLCGLGVYAVGIGFWMLCLACLDLSYAYPFTGLAHVAVLGSAWWLFGDDISLQRIAGVILVCLGVALLPRKSQREL